MLTRIGTTKVVNPVNGSKISRDHLLNLGVLCRVLLDTN
jgi:hypothetical protein